MRVGQARRRDANEPFIVDALESIGVVCYQQSAEGLPDLLTWSRGVWLPVEVKMPGEKLTPAQAKVYQVSPFPIVESVEDALDLFGVRRRA